MPQAEYMRVANDLREKMTTGVYPKGAKLPSRTKICEIYGVSRIVVDRAMIMLRSEGLTETVAGVGVYVK
jgi:DNA-binding GntR family transcriptional regulator